MTPWSIEHAGRRVAASAPVTRATLGLLDPVDTWRPAVPLGPDRPEVVDGGSPADGPAWRTDTFSVVLDRSRPDVAHTTDPWFERGRDALWSYAMVDPAIVRAAWWADAPLLGRRLVQEGRFGPLRLRMATEVAAVVDGVVEVEGRTATVAGFEYRTLEGHLEDGWQSWQLWRWHDTGVLEHRGHTISRLAAIDSALISLGMRVFGRGMQRLAGMRSTARLRAIVDGDPKGTDAPASSGLVLSLASLPEAQRLVDPEKAASAVDGDEVRS